jgi:hypothetical protein
MFEKQRQSVAAKSMSILTFRSRKSGLLLLAQVAAATSNGQNGLILPLAV